MIECKIKLPFFKQIFILNMTVSEYISSIPIDRQALLSMLHETIVANDPTVNPVIKPVMGKEMILYEERFYMKYGLASAKNHMSLHCLPIYMDQVLHAKYVTLLPAAKFQKGCINFSDTDAMPPAIVAALIADCSSISIATMLENRKRNKK
ncbi:DUF1801 domain-containing protein [Chitinophaga flava]|uniref:DUF1801 domain-containing protein n=1 Tax=Chitinophaga flava TaxID=2259036 RepID=A0A365XWJ0_9BACT|nr:DUF1801 domain-containing protein [Chitinophaga flava]RBL90361.1 hypothetical protein DF182_28275 [Chitinophaga flava]